MFTELTNYLDEFLKLGIPGYDCIVYHKGKEVYRHFDGYSDAENKIPMNGKEVYNIYSASKMITCTAALMLIQRGMLRLDDKLSKYLPEFSDMLIKTDSGMKKAEREITIENLFCMTAGFSYDLYSPEIKKCQQDTNGRCPTLKLMEYLSKEPLLFDPGEKWAYSLCHDVLAAVVAVVSGMNFADFVKENIFNPLGMENSTFAVTEDDIGKICKHYQYDENKNVFVPISNKIVYRLGTEYESGGAGCISTVEDYIKFLEALRTGKLLSFETIAMMTYDRLNGEQHKTCWLENRGYGLGVACSIDKNIPSHFGWGGAAGATPAVDIENEFTLFYAQHVITSPAQDRRDNIPNVVRGILKKAEEK